jgi:hypothetical protein
VVTASLVPLCWGPSLPASVDTETGTLVLQFLNFNWAAIESFFNFKDFSNLEITKGRFSP